MTALIKIVQSLRYVLRITSVIFFALLTGCANHAVILVKHNKDSYQAECISKKINRDDIAIALDRHIIDINKKGQFSPIKYAINCPPDAPQTGEQKQEKIQELAKTIASNLEAEHFQELLIYIHGGLVTREAGIESAIEMTQAVLGENKRIYPVSFVWRSGGWESYRDQLFSVRNGMVNIPLAVATSPFKLGSDLGRGIMDTPYAGGLEAHRLFLSLPNQLNECRSTNDNIEGNIICPEPHDFSALTKASDMLGTARYLLMTPVRVGTAPLINGLGRSGYENMLRRTREAFLSDTKLSAASLSKTKLSSEIDDYGGAVYLFFNELQKHISKQNSKVTITLIGHSMGTMLVNEIIRQFPDLPYKQVVYMGAAVSVRDFQNVVIPHLSRSETFKFYNLSLLPAAETREMNDFFSAIPSGSLLEWIDDMFTSPPTLVDRTFGKWANTRDVMPTFPEEAKRNMTIRVFGKRDGQPQKHGEFNDIKRCFWQPSFWTAKDGTEWDNHYAECSELMKKIF